MTTIDDSWYDDLLQRGNETAPQELRAAVRELIESPRPAHRTPA